MRSLTRSFHSIVLILVCCLSSLCLSQLQDATTENDNKIQHYLESLKKGSICQRRAAIIALHQMGKGAIPLLIEHIDDRDIAPSSTLMLHNPILSSAPTPQGDEFSGVINAYVVELILASEALRDEKDCTFLLSGGDYAYGWGVIMKDGQLISATDLAHVKLQYFHWWGKNHNRGLSTLRVGWRKGIRPLTASEYHWR